MVIPKRLASCFLALGDSRVFNPSLHERTTGNPIKVLRVVPLISARGLYGGPADTARAQVTMFRASSDVEAMLMAGVLQDENVPDLDLQNSIVATVRLLSTRLGYASLFSTAFVRTAFRYIKQFDIVHVSLGREILPILVAAMALLLRKKLVAQPHGMLTSGQGLKQRLLDLIVRPLMCRTHGVIALTEVEAGDLQNLYDLTRDRIRVIGNPTVYFESESLTGDYTTDVLYCGRIEQRKRLDTLLETARLSLLEHDGISYMIVGPGLPVDKERILSNPPQNVTIRDPVKPSLVPSLLRQAKVLFLPSYREPWGNVVIMALSLGIPVVLSESAALASKISDAGAGFVAPDGSATDFRSAICQLLQPKVYEKMTQAALFLYQEQFSDAQVESSLAMIYKSVVD
jgi:glycosyltransferase involved in cell wall biosynthesis